MNRVRTPHLLLIGLCAIAAFVWATLRFQSEPVNGQGSTFLIEGSLADAQIERIRSMASDWPTHPDYLDNFNALNPSLTLASTRATLFDANDDYWGLPRDEDGTYELVYAFCGGCHSLSIVMQQNADEARWQKMLDWMEAKQGMAPLPDEFEPQIVEYLSEHF